MKTVRIAIDGPGGAGKSTIAKIVANKLNIDYIDTGAMYRAVGLKISANNVDMNNSVELKNMLDETDIDFANDDIILDGVVVNTQIRTPEMSMMASKCSAIFEVREKLVELQRKMANAKSVIMDGRDIGSNVLTNAEHKFFMTASPNERAERRHKELIEKGEDVSFSQVLNDIIERDKNDTTRKLNPLKPTKDSIILDTTGMGIDDVVEYIMKEVRNG